MLLTTSAYCGLNLDVVVDCTWLCRSKERFWLNVTRSSTRVAAQHNFNPSGAVRGSRRWCRRSATHWRRRRIPSRGWRRAVRARALRASVESCGGDCVERMYVVCSGSRYVSCGEEGAAYASASGVAAGGVEPGGNRDCAADSSCEIVRLLARASSRTVLGGFPGGVGDDVVCRHAQGHPPIPPAQLALATILQAYTGVSDDEVIEATTMDRRWQLVFDCLDCARTAVQQGDADCVSPAAHRPGWRPAADRADAGGGPESAAFSPRRCGRRWIAARCGEQGRSKIPITCWDTLCARP